MWVHGTCYRAVLSLCERGTRFTVQPFAGEGGSECTELGRSKNHLITWGRLES